MNRRAHQLLGAATGAVYASVTQSNWNTALLTVAVSSVIAPLPDCDQRTWWRRLHQAVPDSLRRHGGPLRHRGITHWPGTALLLYSVLWIADYMLSGYLPVTALILGWCSHLLGDFCIGARSRYRGPGIPFAPWWHHRGVGAANGSLLDMLITGCAAFVLIVSASAYL